MSGLEALARRVLEAYNAGDPEPLIGTFGEDVSYEIVHLGQTYRGRKEVAALAREGAGRTRFHLNDFTRSGRLLAYTYDHESALPGREHTGPGLAVQEYDDDGRLIRQWAFRSAAGGDE
ncbi:hypothetical protein SA2016_0074 [Sinomonas atrocyanea]|uniref:SnoaL-like domain-containing protein n=1 Tax=Sinomonas atrocyanea TaxID=37927 RepID=A0A126ZUE2_9MICC|nr:nuclear transport factor 2 family protein [Sinomonas atrocyanea]AMM30779.1 hypothetical protein SA2016_0074 [Sinomonas atrocyanea]GEB63825.1 hypothetical protein SAT01_12730 [Sinomonas atrocyanea]GGG65140.1 hypothetical protein GCM10007172_15760 [Sinomonas atrocyanea]